MSSENYQARFNGPKHLKESNKHFPILDGFPMIILITINSLKEKIKNIQFKVSFYNSYKCKVACSSTSSSLRRMKRILIICYSFLFNLLYTFVLNRLRQKLSVL